MFRGLQLETQPHMTCHDYVDLFGFSEKYTRFCQWKNLELNIQVSGNVSEVYRMFVSPNGGYYC